MKTLLKKKILIPVFAVTIFFSTTGFQNDFFEIAKQIEIFTTMFKELNMNYVDETNPAELMDTAIKNMLDELDPYTKFLNEQDVEAECVKLVRSEIGPVAAFKTVLEVPRLPKTRSGKILRGTMQKIADVGPVLLYAAWLIS